MQGPAESDSCLRRALHSDDSHPSVAPTSFALPEAFVSGLTVAGISNEVLQEHAVTPPPSFLTRSLDSRPPPRA